MLFKGDEGMKPTDALSGGEAVRLIFSKLMLTKDNVLVLDEPTNHLDLESIVALGDALEKYEGTAFVVTHDRDLVSDFATRIWAFTDQRTHRLAGNVRRLRRALRRRRGRAGRLGQGGPRQFALPGRCACLTHIGTFPDGNASALIRQR